MDRPTKFRSWSIILREHFFFCIHSVLILSILSFSEWFGHLPKNRLLLSFANTFFVLVSQRGKGSLYLSRISFLLHFGQDGRMKVGLLRREWQLSQYSGINTSIKILNLALIREMLDIGPGCYCAINSDLSDFEYRLFQVLENLLSHKVCLYPPRTSFGGPFLLPPWDTIGRMFCGSLPRSSELDFPILILLVSFF